MDFCRVDILLEVALLSTHLALPLEVHLQQVYHIFGYLNKFCMSIYDINSACLSMNTAMV